FCDRAKAAASSHGYVAFAQQVKRKLPSATLCSAGTGDIDQRIKGSMRCIEVAAQVFEQAYSKVTTPPVGFPHFSNTGLGAGQGSRGSPLHQGADICVTSVQYVYDRLHKGRSCHDVADAPAGHGIGFGEGIDADGAPAI